MRTDGYLNWCQSLIIKQRLRPSDCAQATREEVKIGYGLKPQLIIFLFANETNNPGKRDHRIARTQKLIDDFLKLKIDREYFYT